MRATLAVLGLGVLLGPGCDDGATPSPIDATAIDADPDPDRTAALALLGAPCADGPEEVYQGRPPPTPWTPTARGTIAACAYDRRVTATEMQAHFVAEGEATPSVTTDAFKFRIAYWTEGDAGVPRLTSGALYLPLTRRGAMSPLVVAGHGSVGVGDRCAPSREHPDGFGKDYRTMIYALIGDGWAVAAPDYPGIGTPGVGTWQLATDEGHAMLDATRAARRLVRTGLLSTRNAIVGHSNGGHAALAAQSYAASYGSDGSIDTVVVWAPLWISNGAWGALISDTGAVLLTPAFMAMTLMYLDGHLDAYDGPTGTNAAFLPDKAAAVRTLLEDRCWGSLTQMATGAASIGIATGRDAFTAEFVADLGDCGLSDQCTSTQAMTWRARFAADRPPPDPTIPIVLWQGEGDTFLPPNYQQCGVDRLRAQNAMLNACQGPGTHPSVISHSADWWRAHLAHVFFGDAAPAACAAFVASGCGVPIPNGTRPTDP